MGVGSVTEPNPREDFRRKGDPNYEQDVRFCDRCDREQGGGIADRGDLACAACGAHDAPWRYVPEAERDVVAGQRDKLAAVVRNLLGNASCRCDHPLRMGYPPCSKCEAEAALAVLDADTQPEEANDGSVS